MHLHTRFMKTLSAALLCLPGCNIAQAQIDLAAQEATARTITGQFTATLLPTLQSALAEGGPAGAIEVCAARAPAIAAELSANSGWFVRRVSLKPRNASSAVADPWEQEVLQNFDERQAAGEPGPTLFASAEVDGEYRFMQALPVLPLCLSCHGQNISEDVLAALAEHYPADLATGYSEGQIRGAISLRLPLP